MSLGFRSHLGPKLPVSLRNPVVISRSHGTGGWVCLPCCLSFSFLHVTQAPSTRASTFSSREATLAWSVTLPAAPGRIGGVQLIPDGVGVHLWGPESRPASPTASHRSQGLRAVPTPWLGPQGQGAGQMAASPCPTAQRQGLPCPQSQHSFFPASVHITSPHWQHSAGSSAPAPGQRSEGHEITWAGLGVWA